MYIMVLILIDIGDNDHNGTANLAGANTMSSLDDIEFRP